MTDKNNLLKLTDLSFPVAIIEHCKTRQGQIFDDHVHEHHLQLFYVTQGQVRIHCQKKSYTLNPSDMLLINVRDFHRGENLSDILRFYIFRFDLELLSSYGTQAYRQKYMEPLITNLILLKNQLTSPEIRKHLETMIHEYEAKQQGFELKLLSCTFAILGDLFRNHIAKSYTQREAEILEKKTQRFQHVLDYIEAHYSDPITLTKVSKMAHISEGYFCRLFKETMGCTLTDYINRLRIEKAVLLLNQGLCNTTEAALSVGFDDINYFCRVFKKYMKQSPTDYRQNKGRYFL